ncbi:PKD domain-containing protein [Luteibaculum oceani]|uniref:PKD domain-containing protein n=1 Tax=Luteibaculum oceani TaxID=1294296 RepID=A0A5C6UUG6_9FLAO|nr:PKD domain-containing protein [Luteibaculum oceani]TXC76244.1 hypothetical protein FRX97_10885 [Luteibaculum oceani]
MTATLRYLLCGILVGFSAIAYGQGLTCATAVTINNVPYSTPFLQNETTCGKGNNYNREDRCGNIYMDDEEFMYEFTPNADMCVTATVNPVLTGIGADAPIALFITEGCPDDLNGKCIAQFTNPDNANNTPKPATLENINLKAGKTYYFQVTARSECFDFTFSLNQGNNCQPDPVGYNCETAQEITSLPFDTTGASNCNRKSFIKEGNDCYSTLYNDEASYLYKYTPKQKECIKITGSQSGSTGRITMHEDQCPTYSDTTCKWTDYWYGSTYVEYLTLDSGKTYYFQVSSRSPCMTYNLNISTVDGKGKTCSDAIKIEPTNNYFEKLDLTTRCMGDDISVEPKCINSSRYSSFNEVVFKYESDGNECISAAAFNVSGYYLNLSMYKGCPSATNPTHLADGCSRWPDYTAGIEYTIVDPGTYYFIASSYTYTSPWSGTTYEYDRDFDFRFSTAKLDPTGINCSTPDALPSKTNVKKQGISVQCKEDDYDPSDACGIPLIGGADYVFTYTPPQDFCGTIVGRNVNGTGGLMLFDKCPDASNDESSCKGAVACEVACDSIYMDVTFKGGKTYYIVGAATTGSFFSFDIEIRKRYNTPNGCKAADPNCPDPNDCDDCLNADFETGNFQNWKGWTGRYGTPKQTPGLDTTYTNDPLSRHTLMNAGGYDPVVGQNKLRTTGPIGERYAARIGNRNSGYQADVLYYEFTVTPETKNFFYYYAVVFNDPSHNVNQQPFFGVEMVAIDDNGIETEIQCAAYEVRADPNDPTFQETYDHVRNSTSTTIRWKDWTLVTVPLDNFMGQDVRIEFTTKDCDQGGHYGYAYIDAFCGDIEMLTNTGKYAICPGESLTLTAPDGFASYQWSTGSTERSITVNTPGNYTVILTPFGQNPLLNCQVTLEQEVTMSDQPTADFVFEEGCIDQFIDFADQSLGSPSFPIESWSWNFGDGTGEYPDTNRYHAFPGPGTYDVRLAVKNTGGCVDTVIKEVHIPDFPTLPPLNAIDTIVICQGDTTRLFAEDVGDVTYSWTGPGFGSSDRTPLVNIVGLQNEGEYIIEAILKADTCVKGYDTTYIDVVPLPTYEIKDDTNKCFLDRRLKLFASGGEDEFSYSWTPANIFDDPSVQFPWAEPDSTTEIFVHTTHTYCPDSTMSMILTIDYYEEMLELVDEITVCEGDSIIIIPDAGKPIEYLVWETPDGYTYDGEEIIHPKASDSLGGYYYVTAYLDDGPMYCQYAYDSVKVNVIPAPDAQITPESARNCVGDSVEFTAQNPMLNMVWTNADGDTVAYGPSAKVLVNDEYYYVTYHNETGCYNRDSVFADEYTMVKPDIGKDRTLCLGDSYKIPIKNRNKLLDDYRYYWNTGEEIERITVTQTGEYILYVEQCGCVSSDTVF